MFSFFSSRCIRKEIENMYSVFLSSYTNTRESLGELEKAVETLACGSCSHSISRSPKLPLVFVLLDRNTEYMFSISFRNQRDEKKENNLLTLLIKMYILFAHTITTSRVRASSVSPSSYTNTIFNQSACVLS